MKKKHSKLQIVVMLWLAFSIPYVIYTQYSYLRRFIADASYQRGLTDAIGQLLEQSRTCDPVPVRLRGQSAEFINTQCITKEPVNANGN